MMKKINNFLLLLWKFSAPLSSIVLMIIGSAFYTSFVSIYLNFIGYSSTAIGLIQSAFFLGMFVGAFKMEKLIIHVGHVQALVVFGSLATCATILQAFFQTFLSWLLLRFISGLSLAAIYIVIESWILDHSTRKNRGLLLSLYMLFFCTGQAVSQQILGFIDYYSATPYLISALFTSLSLIPVSLSRGRITIPSETETLQFSSIFINSPFGVIGTFIGGLVMSGIYTFFPLLSHNKDITAQQLMTMTIAGGVFLQIPVGRLSDYLDRRKVLILVSLVLCNKSFNDKFGLKAPV